MPEVMVVAKMRAIKVTELKLSQRILPSTVVGCLLSLHNTETDHSFLATMRSRHQTRSTIPHVQTHGAWAPPPDRVVNLNMTINIVLNY